MLLRHLFSNDIALHVINLKTSLKLNCFKINWIANLKKLICKTFVVLVHETRIFIDIKNQAMIINKLQKENERLLLKIQVTWSKKMMKSNKAFSSLIIKLAISTTINHMLDHEFIKTYKKCHCEYFKRECKIIQCFISFEFNKKV